MRLIAITTFICFGLLTGCTSGGTWKDDHIPDDVKTALKPIHDKLIDGLRNGDTEQVKAVCSNVLLERDGEKLGDYIALFPAMAERYKFVVTNAFYQESSAAKTATVVVGENSNGHSFRVDYVPSNKESYVVLGYFDRPRGVQSSVFMLYTKYASGWRLDAIHTNVYSIDHKDASDFYAENKKLFANGHYADAALNVGLTEQLLQPAGSFVTYDDEAAIIALNVKIMEKVKKSYKLPYTCNELPTAPVIIGITKLPIDDQFTPTVRYTTRIGIRDSAALSAECDALHGIIGKLYPGLDKNNRRIYYRALEGVSLSPDDSVSYFGFFRDTR